MLIDLKMLFYLIILLNWQLCPKDTSMLGSSNYERGSSWAVEVGGNLKVCSIVVENLNKNGQMVVEVCNGQMYRLHM